LFLKGILFREILIAEEKFSKQFIDTKIHAGFGFSPRPNAA